MEIVMTSTGLEHGLISFHLKLLVALDTLLHDIEISHNGIFKYGFSSSGLNGLIFSMFFLLLLLKLYLFLFFNGFFLVFSIGG